MKYITTILVFIICNGLHAQGVLPSEWGLKAYQIHDPKLGEINYYVTEKGIEEDKPILFMVSGTNGLPTMLVVQSEEQSIQLGIMPPDQIQAFAESCHVAFISKVGTPFCDTTVVEELSPMKNLEEYKPSERFIENCGLEWEVAASIVAIDAMRTHLANSSNTIIALGISEGGQLVPRLAHKYEDITHLVGVVTTTLNQFYSSIINRRMDAAMGNMSHQEAQDAIDSLFAVYKKIYADPENTEKWYYGQPYKRWGSYCVDIPLEHLVELDIPILYVKGSADRNSPVLQSDYAMLEFLRLGKTNLTYKVWPDMDHWMSATVEVDGETRHSSLRSEVFQYIYKWIQDNP